MLAEGEFAATILKAFLGFNNFGDDAVILELGIRDADKNPHEVTWAGGIGTDDYLASTVRRLRGIGFVGNKLDDVGKLKGGKISVTVKHKTGQKGGKYLQIFIHGRKTMTAEESQSLSARMERAVAAVDAQEEPGGGEPPGLPRLPPGATISADDVPF